ncbi:hypothetical protein [Sulfurimonas autotrophica]|nr:hypothetical protein [Sulfurimonas autotrophica]
MDDVLIIATIGVFGVISSNIIYRLIKLKSTIYIYENYIFEKPAIYNFYETYRLPIYIIILITTLTLVYLNIAYQIQLSGIVSKTILLYPLNAIVYWILGTGFSVLLLVLFSLDIKFKNILKMKYLVFFAFIVAITSVGLLSRGQYVFMLGSVIVFLLFNYKNLNNLSISKLVIYILFVALLYLFVIHYVTLLRGYYFSGASLSGALNKVLHLAVDRWIGLEGLMAV